MKNKTTFSIHRGLIAFFSEYCSVLPHCQGKTYKIQLLRILIYWKSPTGETLLTSGQALLWGRRKIWFKGYLVNSVTHQDNTQSNFIITELVNRSDSIVERKRSVEIHWVFIMLSPSLPLSLQVIIICGDIATGCLIRNRNSFIHAI